jgi:hypothetical protein
MPYPSERFPKPDPQPETRDPELGRRAMTAIVPFAWKHPDDLLPINVPPDGRGKQPRFITDPVALSAIITALSQGAFMDPAAEAAGISRDTLNAWLRRGYAAIREHGEPQEWPETSRPGRIPVAGDPEPGDYIYARLAQEVSRAQAHAELAASACLHAAAAYDWKAALALLKTRYNERWREASGGLAAQVRVGDASATVLVLPGNARDGENDP